jgi:carboxymethylenebutenolidase
VVVFAFSTAALALAPPAVRRLRRHPDLVGAVRQAAPEHGLRRLRSGDVDVALVDEWPGEPVSRPEPLSFVELLRDPLVLALPRSHRLTADTGPGGPGRPRRRAVAAAPPGEPSRRALERLFAATGAMPAIAWKFQGPDTVASLVARGLGIAATPRTAVTSRRCDLRWRPLPAPAPTRTGYAAIRRAGAGRPAVSAVLGAGAGPPPTTPSGTRSGVVRVRAMAEDISTGEITVDTLRGYLARPADDGGSGMLLLPMVTGINEQVREFADDIARAGVTALSWDPWHGPSADDTPVERLFGLMDQLDDETVLGEHTRLLDHMFGELGLRRVGVIGWCMGGRFALLLGGRERRLANVVAYHPTVLSPPAANHTLDAAEHSARIAVPVMMLYPGADHLVPRESFDALQTALNGRETGPSIVHVYPGAEHGFSARARQTKPVNAEAYALAWPQTLEFVRATTG